MSKLGEWIKVKWKTQGAFGDKLGVAQGRVSKWVLGTEGITEDYQARIRKLGYTGPWPREEAQEAPQALQAVAGPGMTPKHVEEAFKILMEVADLHKANVREFDRAQFGRVLGIAARELARAEDIELVRREVIHEAEILLGLLK
jgi:hypothetical protein